ncbi:hypothetical protein [Micromonospora inyonensis]|uniref:Uncharacterized protein n=1 Tax=Micromonospora inyonensis TaxID=47866 RepID=A0A1C6RBQ8_9ACTN|nr:hypothetical protein [Micromonospora inyonensis]SCL14573.1 hypothetical protein GA0074694_0824 [Micromonospora inyonensis]
MKSGTRIGLAVGLGYVLGRRRRLRTALTLAAAVAAGRMSRDPAGLRKLGEVAKGAPHLHNLGRLGGPLVGAGRAAATAAVGSGIDAVSGKLRDRAEALRRKTGGDGGEGGSGGAGGDGGGERDSGDGAGRRDAASEGARAGGNGGRGSDDDDGPSGNAAGQRGW